MNKPWDLISSEIVGYAHLYKDSTRRGLAGI